MALITSGLLVTGPRRRALRGDLGKEVRARFGLRSGEAPRGVYRMCMMVWVCRVLSARPERTACCCGSRSNYRISTTPPLPTWCHWRQKTGSRRWSWRSRRWSSSRRERPRTCRQPAHGPLHPTNSNAQPRSRPTRSAMGLGRRCGLDLPLPLFDLPLPLFDLPLPYLVLSPPSIVSSWTMWHNLDTRHAHTHTRAQCTHSARHMNRHAMHGHAHTHGERSEPIRLDQI